MSKSKKFIIWFKNLTIKDVPLVGGKNASLGEMYRNLIKKGVRIPNGFAVTAPAYFHFLEKAKIQNQIKKILKDLNTHNIQNLKSRGKAVRQTILAAQLPSDLERKITENYRQLEKEYGKGVDVAVRSSATAEDLPDASFAGQQETFLNIRGEKALLEACKKCFASLFTDRAISYRVDKKFNHFKIGLSVAVQKMVRSDQASSGVMFSIDTESGFKDVVLIEGSWGLGENVVQGKVNPDAFYVFKPTLAKRFNAIVSRRMGTKKIKMIYRTAQKSGGTKNVPVAEEDQSRYVLTNKEVLQLARWAVIIEKHYSQEAGYYKPMDMEWAKDGITGELYIVQARPETVQSQRNVSILEEYAIAKKGKVLAVGQAVGAKIGAGKANVIKNVKQISQFKKGEVLITKITDPDWEPIMKIASAIVTDLGGRTSHAAIVSRELGVPAIVGTNNASSRVKSGRMVTVSCAEGSEGKVYAGKIPFTVKRTKIQRKNRPQTKIQLIFGTPDDAFTIAQIPNDGVGLAREEFIFTSYIKIHPLALLNFGRLKDQSAKSTIAELTKGYSSKKDYFIEKLASGIGMIGAAFYPNEVIVRLSDFKSNEYANLIGGKAYEPKEENPMIGWRGASRYYDPKYRAAFDLECVALKKVREEMGLKNVKVMVPFCRTVEEGKKVIQVMKENGLVQGKDGLEIFVMIEIPSNVILGEQFAEIFDGFSIGSNDLTQLTLGLDRDSSIVDHVGNENNPAVKELVARIIAIAKKHKIKIGICGQAPSDFPEFAHFLVEHGIDAISLNPDTVMKMTVDIQKLENKLKSRKKTKKIKPRKIEKRKRNKGKKQ
ncbi:MAG: phosphoenolpyruvate synthase [Candidatus Kerfeldbacteria bacterium CG_4_10_14_0_8_um_filter_42_10]|uniref:Phosphoenolpyruvate synthase n=1 Tax=Candidatus Kerfeldbacteria bacterium CG_4_10_14_0_8_um_filter_42_10 TaxID=2014248 RepID=A0A2M7RK88_9BACT|nr:MAG: phosphoenolpyruvate synthase [Candidatus Kerfeldbacteria bacterium CG_4_10_14_0_8_um_filter_42_10]